MEQYIQTNKWQIWDLDALSFQQVNPLSPEAQKMQL